MAETPEDTPTQTPVAPNETGAANKSSANWKPALVKWSGLLALLSAILAVGYGFGGLTMARFDMIEKITGFFAFVATFTPALWIAAIAAVIVILSFVLKTGPRWPAIAAFVLAGVWSLIFYTQVAIPGGDAVPIHDITTDMDNPPQFAVLDRPETSTGPFSIEEWRAFHSEAYGHIQPVVISKAPAQVLGDARALMEDNGWDVALVDAERGHVEGTAYAGYLKFRDDVVVEVTPVADGSTRVDMRSVSQVGVSDLGYNAKRIEAFLADLQAM